MAAETLSPTVDVAIDAARAPALGVLGFFKLIGSAMAASAELRDIAEETRDLSDVDARAARINAALRRHGLID